MTSESTTLPPLFHKHVRQQDVPSLGFGTYELKGLDCLKAVIKAIDTGYRHIDTARAYGNEVDVGEGIAKSGFNREELFLTTKIWPDSLAPEDLQRQFGQSLELLQTDYVDLLLIHWPNPDIPLRDTLGTLHELKHAGKLRNYGVSNFPPSLFRKAIETGEVFCNQVEYHPLLAQDRILSIARQADVLVTAYSPLAQGKVSEVPVLDEIGLKHGKSGQQVAIRWLIEQDHVAAIPRSSKPEHIESNFDVFDFSLDESDLKRIATIPKDRRQINPSFAPDWEA